MPSSDEVSPLWLSVDYESFVGDIQVISITNSDWIMTCTCFWADQSGVHNLQDTITVAPIAHIRSAYKQRHGTPRQAVVGDDGADEPDAELVLCPGISPESLTGLEGFDYVWLITDFNRNRQVSIPTARPY
eukprot:scaffold293731_cov47-Prasinocladus_malaysianus.AAC.1